MSEPNFDFPALREAQAKLDATRGEIAKMLKQAGPDLDMSRVDGFATKDDALGHMRSLNERQIDEKKAVENYRDLARMAHFARAEDREGGDGSLPTGEPKSYTFSNALEKLIPQAKNIKHKEFHQDGVELKTLFSRTAGWDPEDLRSGRLELTPLRPDVHVVDHIPSGSISQSDYKYMEETTHTSNTVEKAEGATYGEAAFALTERSKPVEKIPAWVPVTDEQLEDEPSAMDYLQNRLTQQIRRRLDSQVLVGDGSTPNLLGTESVSGIQTQAKGTDNTMDAAHKLFTKIRDDGFAEPSVVFITPAKWQDVVLTKTADGQYIWGHPSVQGPQTLWGVPVVQTTAHTSTKLIAGDYATYSMLFLRRGLNVQITNAHDTFFINGKQAIRADIRVVMLHFRPKAFGVVTGL